MQPTKAQMYVLLMLFDVFAFIGACLVQHAERIDGLSEGQPRNTSCTSTSWQ